MYCQECGETIPERASVCPRCNTPVEQSSQQTQGQSQPGQQTQPGQQQTARRAQSGGSVSLLSNVSIVGGIIYGGLAFVISFIVNTILVFTELEGQTNDIGLYAGDHILALLGWFFYNAHTVKITASTTGESVNLLETAYQTAGSATTVPKIAYYVVPVVILFLLGYTLANRATSAGAQPAEAAVAGASIAIGYGVVSVLAGNSIFTITEAGESAGPATGTVLLMMGILYPVLVGGAAGYLSNS